MFNLLVSGNSEWWETPPYTSTIDRFKEYSGVEAETIDLARPDTLRRLEEIPAVLMYEVGAGGPHARVVRHGRIRNIVRRGGELSFSFDLDPNHAYLDRAAVLRFADQLGIAQFEQHRTHWAIKDGDIPAELIAAGTAERAQRTVAVVAGEYVEARREGRRRDARELAEELEDFPPSLEKALLLVPARILQQPTPELYPILGIEPRTPEGRNAVEALIARDNARQDLPADWSYSLAWFLDLYGSATEAARLDQALGECAAHLIALGAGEGDAAAQVEEIGYALWRCARSPRLVGDLRREIAVLTDRLVRRQEVEGYWSETRGGAAVPGVRATALATVALQRLGDDRYHEAIRKAVSWLITQVIPDVGALPRDAGDDAPEVIATALAMEAIRRSDFVEDVPHVLAAGDAWLVSGQTVLGGWQAEPWPEDYVAAMVLEYLARQNEMLPQVDGFLLMARDFFRKAEELRLEEGANNRRLAAIATVHAVEMFLYGLFERREDLALSAFRENGTETLGPREALRALQDALQRIGVLQAPQRLPHRDNLSALVGRRDGIIHRAHEISEAELGDGMKHARRFIEKYARSLLDLNLLQ
ncbi:hypothetical protein E0H35_30475 [Rhizobium leguminosarum bv. viciae]|uniref:hypothetical protein n=1 Tax=Rhizobium leguminosarum TaxID=384 RepID=UPI00104004A2|nr:hypothetical protein [Rhizobium leguminosarum]MBY5340420.1 hypothetical protein [Rhizobium leguminosarum]NKK49320.1 hypothetical protein [Rhizobium leguminosarum bv. viciae]TBY90860.1 hypothetical protein E0H35_30475 [Rhizobium leguminosarum bv. viciae]